MLTAINVSREPKTKSTVKIHDKTTKKFQTQKLNLKYKQYFSRSKQFSTVYRIYKEIHMEEHQINGNNKYTMSANQARNFLDGTMTQNS